MMTWQVHHLSGHEQAVNGLCLLPGLGGKSLVAASGSKDGQIRLWDLSSSGECMASLNLPPGSGVSGLATATNTAQPTAGGASGQSPAGEGMVKLYASTTSGHVHAIGVDGLGEIGGDTIEIDDVFDAKVEAKAESGEVAMRVVATAAPPGQEGHV